MLYTIAVVLIILWLLGLVTSYTMGGLIHVLLVIAVIMILGPTTGVRSGYADNNRNEPTRPNVVALCKNCMAMIAGQRTGD